MSDAKTEKDPVQLMKSMRDTSSRDDRSQDNTLMSKDDVNKTAAVDDAEEKKAVEPPKTTFSGLFRFATAKEKLLICVGIVFAAGNGTILPIFAVVFGDLLQSFDSPELLEDVKDQSILLAILGIVSFIASVISLASIMSLSERLTKTVREKYLLAVLRQNVRWIEERKPGVLSSQLTVDSQAFSAATGEKVTTAIQHTFTFLGGIAVGLARGWQLALLIIGATPFMGMSIALLTVALTKFAGIGQKAYAEAGDVADESLTAIRTVTAFNAQEREQARYDKHLETARASQAKQDVLTGLSIGCVNLTIFIVYGFALWFGSWLIDNGIHNDWSGNDWNAGDVITVFFAVVIGAFSLGQAGPSFQAFAAGRSAADRLYAVIDSVPEYDGLSDEGVKPENLRGDLRVRNLQFHYPSRPDVKVFSGLNLEIKAGQNVALVGPSGSGKSSLIGLLERFYDPVDGAIEVDGQDLRSLNLKWWREHVGLVSQEPILFSGTIRENITYGKEGLTHHDVEAAAKAANAHKFIMKLPDKYNTWVGEDGSLLSGGQKQRIAIARAIINDPKILLLDEATSALDNESERQVQAALDKLVQASKGSRTTITIAHRLSTVRNCDTIYVLEAGQVIEQGSHDELMERDGAYANLVHAQQRSKNAEGDEDDEIEEKEVEFERQPSGRHSELGGDERSTTRDSRALTSQKEQKKEEAEEIPDEKAPPAPISRVFPFLHGQWGYILIGTLGSAMTGVFLPSFSLIFGDMLAVLFNPSDTTGARNNALYFCGIGLGLFISDIFRNGGFGIAGARMTQRLRSESYKHILTQEVGFFDEKIHNPRVLTARLATDAADVHAGSTTRAGLLFQVFALSVTGLTIAFVKAWSLALVLLGVGPVLMIASWAQIKFMTGFSQQGQSAFDKAGGMAGEAFSNIRTVQAFRAERFVLDRFSTALLLPLKIGLRAAWTAGIGFGFSQFVFFGTYSLCFWYGATLVEDGDITYADMNTTIFAIIMTAMGIGQTTQALPDIGKAAKGRNNIFALLDRKSLIDSSSTSGDAAEFQNGDIRFENVKFTYPTRPDVQVLNGFSLRVKPGDTVALVGQSGSGKSTVVSLLQRFYDIESGEIRVDGHEIRSLNVRKLRDQIGFVSQEPRLFDASIAENIRYGKPDATDEEVVEAAKKANIHETIVGLPEGYETRMGHKGGTLSGGQKQRVAIARALVRNPRILLLDEATSALDTESERVVQEAIEKLMADRSRTVIIIAHRLSTVRNCDAIGVVSEGRIVELGTHDELMTKGGVYAALAKAKTML